jgi:hypothetical protein
VHQVSTTLVPSSVVSTQSLAMDVNYTGVSHVIFQTLPSSCVELNEHIARPHDGQGLWIVHQ